jgi:hypothetical protein
LTNCKRNENSFVTSCSPIQCNTTITSTNFREGDCTTDPIDGADFLTLLETHNDMGNCYRVICSSETNGAIGHFAGPCDAIEEADDFDMQCDPHHACSLFDNSDVGAGTMVTTAATALAATALAFASLL